MSNFNKLKKSWAGTLVAGATLMAGVALTGCNSSIDEPMDAQPPAAANGKVAIEFIPGAPAQARATETSFETGDRIYVYPFGAGSAHLPDTRYLYRFDGSMFRSVSTPIEKDVSEQLAYLAIYPYSCFTKSGDIFTFRQSTSEDICYTIHDLTAEAVPELRFKHLTTRMNVDLTGSAASRVSYVTLYSVLNFSVDFYNGEKVPTDPADARMNRMVKKNGVYTLYTAPDLIFYQGVEIVNVVLTDGTIYRFTLEKNEEYYMGSSYTYYINLDNSSPAARSNGSAQSSVSVVSAVQNSGW